MALKSKQIDLSPITRLQGQFQREDYLGKAIKEAVGGIGEGIQEAKKQRMFNQARFLEEMKLKISDAHKQYLGDDVDKFIDEYSKLFQEKRGKFKTQDWIDLSKAKEAINNKEARMQGITDTFGKEAPIALKNPEMYVLASGKLESMLKDIGEGNAINPTRNPFTNMMFVEFRDIDLDSVNEQIKRDYRKDYKTPGGSTSDVIPGKGEWTYTRSNYGDAEKARNYTAAKLAENPRALAKATMIYTSLPDDIKAQYQDSSTPIADWYMDYYNVREKYTEPMVVKDFEAAGTGKLSAATKTKDYVVEDGDVYFKGSRSINVPAGKAVDDKGNKLDWLEGNNSFKPLKVENGKVKGTMNVDYSISPISKERYERGVKLNPALFKSQDTGKTETVKERPGRFKKKVKVKKPVYDYYVLEPKRSTINVEFDYKDIAPYLKANYKGLEDIESLIKKKKSKNSLGLDL